MPLVIPPRTNDISQSIAELERAGGIGQQDFRLTYVNGNVALEVTADLYEKWKASKGEQADPASSTPDTPSSTPDTDPAGGEQGTTTTAEKRTPPTKGKAR